MMWQWKPPLQSPLLLSLFFGIFASHVHSQFTDNVPDDLGVLEFLFGKKGIIPKLISEPPLDHPLSIFTRPLVKYGHEAPAPFDAPIIQGAIGNPHESDFFSTLFDKLRRMKYSGREEQFDLPSLGLCSESTCTGLYKIMEKSIKHPMMSNLKLMMSLMQEEDGIETITAALTDKDFMNHFGPGSRRPKPQPYAVVRPSIRNLGKPSEWRSKPVSPMAKSATSSVNDYYATEDKKPDMEPLDFEDYSFEAIEDSETETQTTPPIRAPAPPPRLHSLSRPLPKRHSIVTSKSSESLIEMDETMTQGFTIHKEEPTERISDILRKQKSNPFTGSKNIIRSRIFHDPNPFAEKNSRTRSQPSRVILMESNDAPRRVVPRTTNPRFTIRKVGPAGRRERRRNIQIINRSRSNNVSSPKVYRGNGLIVQNSPRVQAASRFSPAQPSRSSLLIARPPEPVKPRNNDDYYSFYDE